MLNSDKRVHGETVKVKQKIDMITKLYIDTGLGFSNKQAMVKKIIGQERKIEFNLGNFGAINSLRFDPINDYSVLHINTIVIVREDNSSYELDYYYSNALYQDRHTFLFASKNPQIFLPLFNQKIQKIIINLEYSVIGEKSYHGFATYILKYIEDLVHEVSAVTLRHVEEHNNAIQALGKHIHTFQDQINALRNTIEALRLSHQELLSIHPRRFFPSLQWISVNFRKIKRKVKTIPYVFNQDYRLIERSSFDGAYYLDQNPDVEELQINPLVHYLRVGFKEGRNPNPLFDTSYYLTQNPDVADSGINPLVHYLRVGFKEGRNPNPLFDTSYYLTQNPDVADSGINPLVHYLTVGFKEGRNPNPLFDTSYYLTQNPDVADSGINPLVHYLTVGAREGRSPHVLIEQIKYKPKISIVTPVYNADQKFFWKCIYSVIGQIYNNWELCVADHGSSEIQVKSMLERWARYDSRVKFILSQGNEGMAEASNKAVSLATGEFIGFLDCNDTLTTDALYEVVQTINENDVDIIYSDEAIIDNQGAICDMYYKPDFSPDLLFSHNYITHLLVVRKHLFHKVGGFSSKYEGAEDYDLLLKLTEKSQKIYHIPKGLYHRRAISTSIKVYPASKMDADKSGKMALEAALDRQKIVGDVLHGHMKKLYRVKRKVASSPLVSIIIPFKDEPEYLRSCIETILDKTDYQNFEIVGVNNNSKKEETFELMAQLQKSENRISFHEYNAPFNYSKINNYAVAIASGEHIVLMNNDIEIINTDWIEALLEHSQRGDIGAVGAKLYYPHNTIQHAGIIIGIGGFAGHSHRYFPRESSGYGNRLMAIQNVSAVTGALLMIKKRIYEEMGGFDEKHLTIALNDVDFCLRLRERGYLNIFTPYCEAVHYESSSRGYEESFEQKRRFGGEIQYFQWKWRDFLADGDPYYNPNLTLDREDFSIKMSQKWSLIERGMQYGL